jgi:Tfp pilus assembly protein PilN
MKIVNLLPKHKQQELRYESYFHSVLVAAIVGVISLLLVVVSQFGINAFLQRQSIQLSGQIEQAKKLSNKQENAQLKALVQDVNNKLKDYGDLAAASPSWSEALRAFSAQVPVGVKITLFSADTAKDRVDITGFSPTRDQVIQLYNNIVADKDHFHDIDYPLENVARPTNVDFHFSFFVQDKVLHPAKP